MKRTAAAGALLLLVCLATVSVVQAQIAVFRPQVSGADRAAFHVKIVGTHQGAFKGDARNMIDGIRFLQQVSAPRDAGSGMAMGRRQYSPIMFTKAWDAASPQIMQAMATNEVLTNVTFEFVRTDPSGREFVYQTLTLNNATISSVRRYIGVREGNEPVDPRPLEDVSFTFQKYELKDASGTVVTDDASMR